MKALALALLLGFTPQDRSPVPDAAAQKGVEKLLHEVFKDDYLKKSPADRLIFAKKLLRQGMENKDDPSARYFTLREAMDVAASAGDAGTSMQAIDELAKSFDVDPVRLKFAALTTVLKEPRPPETMKAVANSYLALVDEAAAREDLDTAEKAAAAAVASARKAKDVPLAARAEAKAKEGAELKQKIARTKAARDALKANPADPAANLELGQHLCFGLGKWEEGLPLLAKGSQEGLKTLSLKDLGNPEAQAEQIALADEWREAAEKESGPVRQRIRERAALWYSKAYGSATGLAKVKIEKRLAEIGSVVHKIAPVAKDGVAAEGLVGWWRLDEGSGTLAEDASGAKRHATLSDGAEWAEGRFGKGIRMAGKGEVVSVPDAPELRITGDLTLCVWYRRDGSQHDWVRLIGKGAGAQRNYGVWLGAQGHRNQVLFQQYDTNGQQLVELYSATTITNGVWTHVAAVIQGQQTSLYYNGRKEGAGTRQGTPITNADPVTFGYSGFHQSMVGVLDDLRIYNRALTAAEIETLSSMK